MSTLGSSRGKGALSGVSHQDKAVPIEAEQRNSGDTAEQFRRRLFQSKAALGPTPGAAEMLWEGSRSSPSLSCPAQQDLTVGHSRALATTGARLGDRGTRGQPSHRHSSKLEG